MEPSGINQESDTSNNQSSGIQMEQSGINQESDTSNNQSYGNQMEQSGINQESDTSNNQSFGIQMKPSGINQESDTSNNQSFGIQINQESDTSDNQSSEIQIESDASYIQCFIPCCPTHEIKIQNCSLKEDLILNITANESSNGLLPGYFGIIGNFVFINDSNQAEKVKSMKVNSGVYRIPQGHFVIFEFTIRIRTYSSPYFGQLGLYPKQATFLDIETKSSLQIINGSYTLLNLRPSMHPIVHEKDKYQNT
ncbi:25523_t:CDS:2, partial [Racocetra persica]